MRHPVTTLGPDRTDKNGYASGCSIGQKGHKTFGILLFCFIIIVFSDPVMPPDIHAKEHHLIQLTAEEESWLAQNAQSLKLFFNTDFPPVEFISSSGTFTGIGAEVMALVEKKLGVIFPKEPCPDWNVHLNALKTGECAIAPTIVHTAQREDFAYFTVPYATVPIVIIGTKNSPIGIHLDDLAGKKVGVVSGYATEEYLRKSTNGDFTIITVDSVTNGLREVSFNHIDVYVENLAVAAYYIDKEGIPNLRVVGSTDYSFAWSIGVSRKYPLLFSAIQKTLAAVPPGELESIRKKWISLQVQEGLSPEMIKNIKLAAVFIILLVLGLGIISFFLKRRLNEKILALNQSQERMAQSEAKFRAIFDHAPYAIAINSLDGRYLDANPAMLKSRNIQKKELLKQKAMEFAQLSKDEESFIIDQLAQTGSVSDLEATVQMADGFVAHALYSSTLVNIQGEKQVLSMVVDVTKLKQAEKKVKESEERFRSLFQMAPVPLAELTQDGRVLAVNNKFQELLGYTRDDTPTIEQWWEKAYPDPDYRCRAMARWQAALDQSEETGNDFQTDEYQVTGKDGTVRTMILRASIINDNLLVSFFDVTDRKLADAEQKRLQEQLLQAHKLEAVGILAGGVAHDFNNMLGAIIGYAQLTMIKMAVENPLRKNLEKILDAGQRSAALTRQLLAFARKQAVTPMVFNMNQSINSMLKMLKRLIGENIELIWIPEDSKCTVKMDPSQLDQILTNLCVNARDAIDDIGKVTIKTQKVIFDELSCTLYPDCLPGSYIQLMVSDNGCGMDKQTKEHIFEPFFTTKGLGKGTGLGLATLYGIVKQNNGFISLYSEPGMGTTFNLFIPHHLKEAETEEAETTGDIPHGNGETILIVEDDPTLMEMGEMMLQGLGYEVLSAATPTDAIRIFDEKKHDIDLVITDVIMPEMNGRDLTDRILKIKPDMKYMFISGYTADIIAHQGVLDEGAYFIQKPFSLRDLAVKIESVLTDRNVQ